MLELIYVGEKFSNLSMTAMGTVYDTKGQRRDYDVVKLALQCGEDVYLRQATAEELARCEAKLADIIKGV